MKTTGANAILQSLLINEVDTIFGLPGGQMDYFFDAMHANSNAVKYIGTRHEQGAAYMAFGYARSTGRVGTYTVVPGPGVLNTTAALSSAYACNTPVLCVTGQIPSKGIGTGRGYLHEIPDQLATMRSLTKWAERIDHPKTAPQVVKEAFRNLETGRPRPVSIEMPMDMMAMESDVELLDRETYRVLEPDTDRIDDAAKILAKAKRPVIVVGGGAVDATEEVLALAELLQAPVISFRSGRGVVSDRHYLGMTFAQGYEAWKDADAVIGIGSRMKQQLMYWGTDKAMKIIHIDIDPTEIGRIQMPDAGSVADAGAAIRALVPAVEKLSDSRESREDELSRLKGRVNEDILSIQPQMSYLDIIRSELPDDGYFVDEITQVGFASWYGLPVYEPRHIITCGPQGTLGYGFATALGVKVAHPDKPVIGISGDGGFMFNVQELATAVRYNIGLVMIVFNNGIFENVRRQQKEWFGGRFIGSDLQNPDFMKLADAFGLAGHRAETPDALRAAIQAGLKHNGPTLIEVPVGEMAAPWKYIIRDQLRGAN